MSSLFLKPATPRGSSYRALSLMIEEFSSAPFGVLCLVTYGRRCSTHWCRRNPAAHIRATSCNAVAVRSAAFRLLEVLLWNQKVGLG